MLAITGETTRPFSHENFSFGKFFGSFEIHAAKAAGWNSGKNAFVNSGALSRLLPDTPEFKNGTYVLDEIIPEEEAFSGTGKNVPAGQESRIRFDEPVAVHDPVSAPVLSELKDSSCGNDMISDLFGESEDESESPWIEHKVASGERMVDISRKYGILVATISKANHISNPNRLALGQVLLIPRSEDLLDDVLEEQKSREEAKNLARQKADPVKYRSYKVKTGDSLWTIASSHNLSIETLYGTNVMRNPDRLSPGTMLRIPNQDGLTVKLAKGQTLSALAKKYSVSEKAIRMANELKPETVLKAGQEIFVPGASRTITMYRAGAGGGGRSRRAPKIARAARGVKGMFSWPLVGRISSPFGWRTHPIHHRRSFHAGIDIARPRHTPIRAARDGQVIFAGWMRGYGRTIILRHDSTYTTLYAHAQSLKARKGQYVRRGAVIATVGSSGRSTGPHCHFEVRRNNKPTNPIGYLR